MVDPPYDTACRALRQPISHPIKYFVTPKSSKTSQFAVIRRSTGIGSCPSESYYRSYTVATSCVNRCASRITHNRLFRKKLQEILLHMISTELSSLAAHNKGCFQAQVGRRTSCECESRCHQAEPWRRTRANVSSHVRSAAAGVHA
jgi:hypothetical protein